MFWPIKKGTVEVIGSEETGGVYECWIPPVGYGCHSETGEIKRTDIIKRSAKKSEQFWERTPLPADWTKKRRIEMQMQERDPDYYDPELEAFREQEWKRRLYGVWFYNNGVPTYITGEHYMYLNWWPLDDGYPRYREPDRKRYYVEQYCIQDDRCGGLLETSNRRSGKSYRGGLFVFDYVSRSHDAIGGIQSKTDIDAKNLFKSKIVTPFRRIPDFFRPEIDTTAGINPEKELKFTTTSKRGKRSLENIDDLGLNSFINYQSSEKYAYDGWKIHRYLGDEVGKTEIVNVYERHQVVKYCLRVGKNWIGKALYTTTVELLESGNEAFFQLWRDSNPLERDENGHTKSGLYRYFTPAYEMYDFDKYGFPLIEEGKTFYLNTRKALADNPRALSSEIKKNPFTVGEMFMVDGERCLYDAMKLNIQLDNISWKELTERGSFEWKDGERFGEVIWRADKNGRFELCRGFKMLEPNKVIKRNDHYFPNNTFMFRMGADPFKYDKVKDNRRSDGAALVYKMDDPLDKGNPFNNAFVCKYKYRADTTRLQYEDMLKMAWYFGCQILFERNVDNWKEHFRDANCTSFLMKLPGEDDYGIYSDGHGKTHQLFADYTEAYINEHIEKVFFKDLIKEWLEFDIGATTKFDLAMAAGATLVAVRQKLYQRTVEAARDVSQYFKTYSAA